MLSIGTKIDDRKQLRTAISSNFWKNLRYFTDLGGNNC